MMLTQYPVMSPSEIQVIEKVSLMALIFKYLTEGISINMDNGSVISTPD